MAMLMAMLRAMLMAMAMAMVMLIVGAMVTVHVIGFFCAESEIPPRLCGLASIKLMIGNLMRRTGAGTCLLVPVFAVIFFTNPSSLVILLYVCCVLCAGWWWEIILRLFTKQASKSEITRV